MAGKSKFTKEEAAARRKESSKKWQAEKKANRTPEDLAILQAKWKERNIAYKEKQELARIAAGIPKRVYQTPDERRQKHNAAGRARDARQREAEGRVLQVKMTPEQLKANRKKYREANKEKLAAVTKLNYLKRRDDFLAYAATYRAENKEKLNNWFSAYRALNKEKISNTQRLYRQGNKEYITASKAEYQKRNSKELALKSAAYYEENKAVLAERQKIYVARNRDRVRITKMNYRARKRNNGGRLSPGLAKKLFTLQQGKCACCGLPLGANFHLDHIMPLALGGPNTDDNIQLLRQRCNNQKLAKHPVDFMRSRGFLL